jgi:hypothetical protein
MNDFTLDELRFIWNRLAVTDYTNAPDMVELGNKVHSMIENYCDHDFVPCLAKINIDMCKHPKCLAIK